MLNTLEHMLVQEFRACQALLNLNQEIRLALIQNKTAEFLPLQSRELALRQDLMVQDHGRQIVVEKLFQLFPLGKAAPATALPAEQTPALEVLLCRLDGETATRCRRLYEGIQILRAQIRTISRVNISLAQLKTENQLRGASAQVAERYSAKRKQAPDANGQLQAAQRPQSNILDLER